MDPILDASHLRRILVGLVQLETSTNEAVTSDEEERYRDLMDGYVQTLREENDAKMSRLQDPREIMRNQGLFGV